MAAVFHVEFGINETPLTRALEENDYVEAQRLITSHCHTSYLDEGCYQRTPLYITLVGKTSDNRKHPRNFHLAKLLAQNGASVNFRVPETYIGCEYMGPGKSALELLTELYNTVTIHKSHHQVMGPWDPMIMWDPQLDLVIGNKGESISTKEQLVEEILEMIFIMLAHGGDTSIPDENHMTLLHRTAIYSKDPRLLHLLCETSAALNSQNIKGSTPLGALCDPFPLGVNDFISNHQEDVDPYRNCCELDGKEEFVEFLATQKDVQLDISDRYGRTPLFYCMVRGNVKCARLLLKHGADPTLKGQVVDPDGDKRFVSPLFASMFSQHVVQSHEDKYVVKSPASLSYVSPLVDAGYFDRQEITNELIHILTDQYPELLHLKQLGDSLLHATFGTIRISLKQHCCRLIFQRIFFHPTNISNDITEALTSATYFQNPVMFQRYLDSQLNTTILQRVIQRFHLPTDTLLFFEVELFRQRLFCMLRQCRWFYYCDPDIDGALDFCDSEEDLTDEGDSDLEYW